MCLCQLQCGHWFGDAALTYVVLEWFWLSPLVDSVIFKLPACWSVAAKCEGWCVKRREKPVKLVVTELTCQLRETDQPSSLMWDPTGVRATSLQVTESGPCEILPSLLPRHLEQ